MQRRISEELDQLIVKTYQSGKAIRNVAKMVNVDPITVRRSLIRHSIDVRPNSFYEKIVLPEKAIVDSYQRGISTTELAKTYKVSLGPINKILEQQNVTKRKRKDYCKFNKHIFDVIDTPEKAYWLGFLCADGCNHRTALSLTLQIRDIDHVKKFAAFVDHVDDVTVTKRNQAKILLCSRHTCAMLSTICCAPNKSLNLRFPNSNQVPDHLIRHFIRGLFDGDGCIYLSKNLRCRQFCITTTLNVCQGLRKVMTKELKIRGNKYRVHKNKRNRIFRVTALTELKRLHTWLYTDATICLPRKKLIFDTISKLPSR